VRCGARAHRVDLLGHLLCQRRDVSSPHVQPGVTEAEEAGGADRHHAGVVLRVDHEHAAGAYRDVIDLSAWPHDSAVVHGDRRLAGGEFVQVAAQRGLSGCARTERADALGIVVERQDQAAQDWVRLTDPLLTPVAASVVLPARRPTGGTRLR
jgi:hypothetical protein